MTVRQHDFTTALLNPAAPVPHGLTGPAGRPAGKRFDVYRNNVAVSLTEALKTAFPVLRALVGDAFFEAMAGVFLRDNPPESPLMMHYGAQMPGFLAGFAPVRHLAYLPDIARLELALRESYHAKDATPVAPEVLMALPPDRLMQARLRLAPALRLLHAPFPVASIWLAHRQADAPKPAMRPEAALITRPGFDPVVSALPPGGGAFVAGLLSGQPLATALAMAEAETPDFDLTETLGLLISGQAIIAIEEKVLL
ncbi:MAG: DUF2063 domain-containing protein [Confluentimicrobium sp.]|uniref:HvfC/BufC N-terminal domain-containing protein n=1 Tax=Actibacterium sp. TaxID=1872125 RepID=UPI000C6A2340|nr:DNA-binding domain-containing protein [Actibacterium sp.]MBC58633.1 DUF2063 domain-containing protein [Actibacterium sp.]